ncbi:hypothetical protein H7J73_07525 [Mycolicibacterium komossense]|uniref:Uncharacterized protein n=1 Tax=Mycolicibacterium komossense TaxID=1779 RepID=A0ABT3C8Y1_9MYCO|nr:hypothetical protein [Mycolicibacterium komossense]
MRAVVQLTIHIVDRHRPGRPVNGGREIAISVVRTGEQVHNFVVDDVHPALDFGDVIRICRRWIRGQDFAGVDVNGQAPSVCHPTDLLPVGFDPTNFRLGGLRRIGDRIELLGLKIEVSLDAIAGPLCSFVGLAVPRHRIHHLAKTL